MAMLAQFRPAQLFWWEAQLLRLVPMVLNRLPRMSYPTSTQLETIAMRTPQPRIILIFLHLPWMMIPTYYV
jgi:hypothetical protein